MLRGLVIAAAKSVPSPLRRWLHSNRRLSQTATRLFASLVGSSIATIPEGPMKGIRLVPSRHTSHAHLRGVYESDVLGALNRLVAPGMVCYDIGASIGYLTLLMAGRARAVYSFEPAPHARAEMAAHIRANGFANVTVVDSPLSGSVREVEFALTDVAYGSGILSDPNSGWPTLKLSTSTLDLFAAGHEDPDFLKVDIEGEEAVLFDGAQSLLARKAPVILCELHSLEAQNAVLASLKPFGYRFENLGGQAFQPRDRIVAGEFHVVAIPPQAYSPHA